MNDKLHSFMTKTAAILISVIMILPSPAEAVRQSGTKASVPGAQEILSQLRSELRALGVNLESRRQNALGRITQPEAFLQTSARSEMRTSTVNPIPCIKVTNRDQLVAIIRNLVVHEHSKGPAPSTSVKINFEGKSYPIPIEVEDQTVRILPRIPPELLTAIQPLSGGRTYYYQIEDPKTIGRRPHHYEVTYSIVPIDKPPAFQVVDGHWQTIIDPMEEAALLAALHPEVFPADQNRQIQFLIRSPSSREVILHQHPVVHGSLTELPDDGEPASKKVVDRLRMQRFIDFSSFTFHVYAEGYQVILEMLPISDTDLEKVWGDITVRKSTGWPDAIFDRDRIEAYFDEVGITSPNERYVILRSTIGWMRDIVPGNPFFGETNLRYLGADQDAFRFEIYVRAGNKLAWTLLNNSQIASPEKVKGLSMPRQLAEIDRILRKSPLYTIQSTVYRQIEALVYQYLKLSQPPLSPPAAQTRTAAVSLAAKPSTQATDLLSLDQLAKLAQEGQITGHWIQVFLTENALRRRGATLPFKQGTEVLFSHFDNMFSPNLVFVRETSRPDAEVIQISVRDIAGFKGPSEPINPSDNIPRSEVRKALSSFNTAHVPSIALPRVTREETLRAWGTLTSNCPGIVITGEKLALKDEALPILVMGRSEVRNFQLGVLTGHQGRDIVERFNQAAGLRAENRVLTDSDPRRLIDALKNQALQAGRSEVRSSEVLALLSPDDWAEPLRQMKIHIVLVTKKALERFETAWGIAAAKIEAIKQRFEVIAQAA